MGKQSRMKKEKYQPAPWTAFQRMNWVVDPKRPDSDMEIPACRPIYRNSRFQVQAVVVDAPPPFGRVVWLSIKRIDREQMHDWRELQRIKNELVGAEVEAVEIYPAESRLVDTSNQYHLWCFVGGLQLPFGYSNRVVIEHPELSPEATSAKQREWVDDNRPSDVKTPAQVAAFRIREFEQRAPFAQTGSLFLKPDGGFRYEP